MKTIKNLAILSLIMIMALTSCSGGKYKKGDRMPETTSATIDSVSYALGVWCAGTIKHSDFGELDYASIMKGIKDMLNDKTLKISEDQVMPYIQGYFTKRMEFTSKRNLEEGTAFLEKNKTNEGVVTTETGLQYEIVKEGEGAAPTTLQDTVEVKYKGTLINGTEFDSSYKQDPEKTVKFPLDGVIRGWGEGLLHAKEGGTIKLFIPSELGYGPNPQGPIPGNSALIFEVELVKVLPYVEPVVVEQKKK